MINTRFILLYYYCVFTRLCLISTVCLHVCVLFLLCVYTFTSYFYCVFTRLCLISTVCLHVCVLFLLCVYTFMSYFYCVFTRLCLISSVCLHVYVLFLLFLEHVQWYSPIFVFREWISSLALTLQIHVLSKKVFWLIKQMCAILVRFYYNVHLKQGYSLDTLVNTLI